MSTIYFTTDAATTIDSVTVKNSEVSATCASLQAQGFIVIEIIEGG
jgi:hypothetical protein